MFIGVVNTRGNNIFSIVQGEWFSQNFDIHVPPRLHFRSVMPAERAAEFNVLTVEVTLLICEIVNRDMRLKNSDRTVLRTEGPADFAFVSLNAETGCITHLIDEVVLNNAVGSPC